VLTPIMPIEFWSFRDPDRVVSGVVSEIDRAWRDRAEGGSPYERVVLVGYSFGSVLLRQAYCHAAGARPDATLAEAGDPAIRPWVADVRRIVLLAGLNRGWTVDSPVSRIESLFNNLLTAMAHLVPHFKPTLFSIRRGAPFRTRTRLQWLALRDKGRLPALTVQLLGTRDDLVSPADNIDLATGSDFLYLEVPNSGHFDVVKMRPHSDSLLDAVRRRKRVVPERGIRVGQALTAPREELERDAVSGKNLLALLPAGSDPVPDAGSQPRRIDDVVFVLHGIRDKGYWTHKVARAVANEGDLKGKGVLTVAPTYGYFALLPFLLPWSRRAKVEWLLDMYVALKSRYPAARFSFIGHSNGTYILAGAIESCPAVRFHNVVFAGSVVNTRFQWARYVSNGQVARVLNYVATGDWVVAIFPRFLQRLGLRDLGGAGHDGFETDAPVFDQEYVRGRHGAALEEQHWQGIAEFIFDGPSPPPSPFKARSWWAVALGHGAWLVWLGLLLFALVPTYGLLLALGISDFTGLECARRWQEVSMGQPGWRWALVLMAWIKFLSLVLTKL